MSLILWHTVDLYGCGCRVHLHPAGMPVALRVICAEGSHVSGSHLEEMSAFSHLKTFLWLPGEKTLATLSAEKCFLASSWPLHHIPYSLVFRTRQIHS